MKLLLSTPLKRKSKGKLEGDGATHGFIAIIINLRILGPKLS